MRLGEWMTRGSMLVYAGLALSVAQGASADPIFRWVDAQGVVNYGNQPPEAGPSSKTVRAIDPTPAVVAHESDTEMQAREQRALAAELAEEARLKRQLLLQQIETEQARADALRAQAANASSGVGATCAATDTDCDGLRYIVAWGHRPPNPLHGRPGSAGPAPRDPLTPARPSSGQSVSVHPAVRAF